MFILAFAALMIVAAVKDLTSYTIPNWIPVAMIAVFAAAAPFLGLSWGEAGLHAAIGFAALILGMAGFAMGWFGGGDAKIFAAAALWLGWPDTLMFLAFSALAGGALTLALLGARRFAPPRLMAAWPSALFQENAAVPYGLALAVGALAALPNAAIFSAATGI